MYIQSKLNRKGKEILDLFQESYYMLFNCDKFYLGPKATAVKTKRCNAPSFSVFQQGTNIIINRF